MGQAHSIGLLHIGSYIAVLLGQQERGGVSKQKKKVKRKRKDEYNKKKNPKTMNIQSE